MRRFVTELTVEECVARAEPLFGPRLWQDMLSGELSSGRVNRAGFEIELWGKPVFLRMRAQALTVRGRFAPSPAGGTTIDVALGIGLVSRLGRFVPVALPLPVVLATILFNSGIENTAWSLAWRWVLVALAVLPGAFLARLWWRADLRWLAERDVAGRWIARIFDAVEVPPYQGSDGSRGAPAGPDPGP